VIHHDYEAIVREALTEPGKVAAAYSQLHNFSIANQFLAIAQLGRVEPVATFNHWREIGRHVKRGEKAIELLMPVIVKKKDAAEDEKKMIFVSKHFWFGLHQTDGAEYVPPPTPDFDLEKAIVELNITKEPFACMNGNVMGYAIPAKRVIAVSDLAYDRFKTAAHEVFHVQLEHGTVAQHAETDLPSDAREVEAETGAYLLKTALGLTDNLEYSRGYIQGWIGDGTVEKVRFGKVFGAVDAILKAGRIEPERPAIPALADNPSDVPA
jgi:hypothetical protein